MSRPRAAPPDLGHALAARYSPLASTAGSLSCGDVLEHGAPRPGETVIDLGCGRGRDLLRAAEAVGPDGRAIGVDGNEAMLAAARALAAGAPRVSLVRGDVAAVPLPDGDADLVISNCAINHAPDKAAVYREVHRLLRPGGRFVVSDVVSETTLPASVRDDPEAWAACYGGAIPEAEYLADVASAGFSDVRVLRRSAPYVKGGVRVLSLTVTARRPS
ncbi:methyltransferase domain-containing protein [Anaeromyxobacter sp. Fw109-5]|uniref:methyltransferase domain-containing protein n=1 Tax=Anaeromyxobacter sp. (strain Fw109-5) TaxID=404589 RepID=UPI0000ED7457|nr:methyltransferase domain-containing protein [Anaeromyxobacter sp. Fw109-5]ABS26560.1 Methyltransferase type 11 [Anaeromyxobacter sp. Fw109-5]